MVSNPSKLEVLVGDQFTLDSLTLPLIGETSLLIPKITLSSTQLKLLKTTSHAGIEGVSAPATYTIQACASGVYTAHLHFTSFDSTEQWIPTRKSSLYGQHEQTIAIYVK